MASITTSRGRTRIRLNTAVGSSNRQTSAKQKINKDLHDSAASFGVVYANEPAQKVIASGNKWAFPVGSIIVREKLIKEDDKEPQVLVVMIKRERGFNPPGGDWLFLTADGAMTKISERQTKGSCLTCHKAERKHDFVFPLTGATSW